MRESTINNYQREKVKAGLRHAVVCPNVTGRTKDRTAQSKRVCVGSLEIVDKPMWRKLIYSGRFADVRCLLLALRFFLFCFVFVFLFSFKPQPFD